MGRFARDAPWLRKLFPPTGTPQTTQPSAVSDDVQLVENYQAGGQVAIPVPWFEATLIANGGSGVRSSILDPFVLLPTNPDPEVWRVFFMAVSSDGDPGAFSFNVEINLDGAAASVIQIANGVTIGATSTAQVAINSTFGLTAPVLLPITAAHRAVLTMIQTSAQGSSTVILTFHFYILKNPAGVTHYL